MDVLVDYIQINCFLGQIQGKIDLGWFQIDLASSVNLEQPRSIFPELTPKTVNL